MSLTAVPLPMEKSSPLKKEERESSDFLRRSEHVDEDVAVESCEARITDARDLAVKENEMGYVSPENSDEELTSQEVPSNRSSEILKDQTKCPEDILWGKALQRLQMEEERWYDIFQDTVKKDSSMEEINRSLLQAASTFQSLDNQSSLEDAIKKIEFAADQYFEARKAYFRGDNDQATYYERVAEAIKRSVFHSVIAREYFFKAGNTHFNVAIAERWGKASKEAEIAEEYYLKAAKACQSQDIVSWNYCHRFAWTAHYCSEQLVKIATYLEKLEKASFQKSERDDDSLRERTIKQMEASVAYYTQALQAHAEGNHANWLWHVHAAEVAQKSARQFEKLTFYMLKAIPSHLESAVVVCLSKFFKKASFAEELYLKAEQYHFQGRAEEAWSLQQAALKNISKAEKNLEQVKRISEASDSLYNYKINQKNLGVVDTISMGLHKALEQAASSDEITERWRRFHLAAQHYQLALGDWIEVEKQKYQIDVSLKPIEELCRYAAEQSQRAGDYFISSAEKLLGNLSQPEVGQQTETTFCEAAQLAVKSADAFRKAVLHWLGSKNARERGEKQSLQLEQLYETSQTTAQLYAQAAELRQNKQSSEASMLQQAAEANEKKEEALLKTIKFRSAAIEIDQEVKNEIGKTCYTLARKNQLLSEHYENLMCAYRDNQFEEIKKYENIATELKKKISLLEESHTFLRAQWEDWKAHGLKPYYLEKEIKKGTSMLNNSLEALEKYILVNHFSTPYIRIEKIIDPSTGILEEVKMASDHLIVELNEKICKEDLKQAIEEKMPGSVREIKEIGKIKPLYSLYFEPDKNAASPWLIGMEKMQKAVQDSNLTSMCKAEPLLKVRLDTLTVSCASPVSQEHLWNLCGDYGITPPPNFWKNIDKGNEKLESNLEPITAGILDSGIMVNRETGEINSVFKNSIVSRVYSSLNGQTNEASEDSDIIGFDDSDIYGHGTHVAGIIAANSTEFSYIRRRNPDNAMDTILLPEKIIHCGIAIPAISEKVSLVACQWLRNIEDGGLLTDLINAISYARNNGARVLNCSFAFTLENLKYLMTNKKELENVESHLSNDYPSMFPNNVIVVCSAGNKEGEHDELDNDKLEDEFKRYPASFELPNILTVAATNNKGTLAEWSHYGKKSVDLAAPGENIISISNRDEDLHQVLSGTSFSVPHIVATLMLMMTKFPQDKNDISFFIQRLKATCNDLLTKDREKDDQHVQAGRLNLARALKENFIETSGDSKCISFFSKQASDYEDVTKSKKEENRDI